MQWFTAAAVFLIPLIVSPTGSDTFRLPKELAFRGAALIAAALLVPLAIWERERFSWLREARFERLIGAGIVLWSIFSAALATHPVNVARALATIFCSAILFVAAATVSRAEGAIVLTWSALAGAVVNGLVYLAQATIAWSPIDVVAQTEHLADTALLGNPNDVGMMLAAPAIAAIALALTTRGRVRMLAVAAAVLCALPLVMSQTVTAIGALAGGALCFVARASRRAAIASTVAAFFVIALLVAAYAPLRERAGAMIGSAKRHDYGELSSYRIIPFLAAWEMLRDRPLTGVGPGGYSYEFFDYKLRVDEKYHRLMPQSMENWQQGRRVNFGEAHNEWLQTAAELGVIGFALLAAAVVTVARHGRRLGDGAAVEDRFASQLAIPLALSFTVLSMAQFPLRLAAPRLMFLVFAAIVVTRSSER